MKGLGRVVIGSAVGGVLGAAAFFAVDGLMPAKSAPIHLICNETEITKDTREIDTAGRISNSTGSGKLWDDIPVMISPEQGTAKVWTTNYSLTVYPDRYQLSLLKQPPAVGVYPRELQITKWVINRQTLGMKYDDLNTQTTKLMYGLGYQKSRSERESVGICKITPAPANNRI